MKKLSDICKNKIFIVLIIVLILCLTLLLSREIYNAYAAESYIDCEEIGADWNHTDKLKVMVKNALIPTVVAGGEVLDSKTFFESTQKVMQTGIIGVSFGRNVFMSNNPAYTMK